MSSPMSSPIPPNQPPNQPLVRHFSETTLIIAPDASHLRELLSPTKDPVGIGYSVAHAVVPAGGRTLDHYLDVTEVYYVIQGSGVMYLDGQPHRVQTGSIFYIPAGCRQWLDNDSDEPFAFICIVEPAWTPDVDHLAE